VVEEVVDDQEEGVRAGRMTPAYSLAAVEIGVEQVVMPIPPFIGVRTSWLTLDRNSLRARLAASACSRASATRSAIPRAAAQVLRYGCREVVQAWPPDAVHIIPGPDATIAKPVAGQDLSSSPQQRLLIVEDDVHGYRSATSPRRALCRRTIADGRKAVERIRRGDAVDLVLLDGCCRTPTVRAARGSAHTQPGSRCPSSS
jgi:hypothetical protein